MEYSKKASNCKLLLLDGYYTRTKYKNLVKLGIPEHYAATIANSRRKYWYISNNKAVIWALNKERLINSGFYDLATAYQSVHVNY